MGVLLKKKKKKINVKEECENINATRSEIIDFS